MDKKTKCPHCGAHHSDREDDIWAQMMDGGKSDLCMNCNKPMGSPQDLPEEDAGEKIEKSVPASNDNQTTKFWGITLFLLCVVFFLNKKFNVFQSKEDIPHLIYEIVFVLVVSSAVAFGKTRQKLTYLLIWLGIFLVFMVGYSFRSEVTGVKNRVMAELLPDKGFQERANSIRFPVSADGHFYVRANVNGVPIRFLADTGASHIVLTPRDAEKIGIDATTLKFDRIYETANGRVRGSFIRISDFEVGGFHLKKIGASVNEVNMGESLLGMTFFKRLERYEVKDDMLTLYWKE